MKFMNPKINNRDLERDLTRIHESRSLTDYLLVRRQFLPEEKAPPIDRELLKAYVERKLSRVDADRVSEYTASFKSWNDALSEVLEATGR